MKSFFRRLRYNRLASTFTILATLSVGILIGSVVAHGVHGQEEKSTSKINTSDAVPLTVPAPKDMATDFTRIAKEVGPAVVNISTVELPKSPTRSFNATPFGQQGPDNGGNGDNGPDNFQDFFNHFFGGMPGFGGQDDSSQERESLGSGFIVDPHGYILTNYHVIAKADKIWVRLSTDPNNGFMQGRPATVVGYDKATDIAVLKINTDKPLPTVQMGNSSGAQVGDWVIAIGSPFTLSQTVTAGIISAKNRTNPGIAGQFQHFIQTDAAINPGNSGGPLVNMAGQVIGMNTAIYTESGSFAGIGFAMPSNTIIHIYNDLIGPEHKVVRGSIGITFQPNLPAAVAHVYGFSNGVLVSSVQSGFSADKAGIKPGDVIVSVDGQPIKDGNDLVNNISARKPGSTVQLGYIRNGQHMTTTVTIGDRDKMMAALTNGQGGGNGPGENGGTENAQAKLGITVSNLPQGAPAGLHGVLIQHVKPGSFADEIGLSEGLVIVAINRHQINDVNDFRAIVAGLRSGDDVAFQLVDPQDPTGGSRYLGGTLP
ncbi:MAG TPA: trypsin-like peptidase domain-containing protein [Acidobacteriaceae bacterium]|nr:trypsin-like peptidase domain-containing protein [Acidobacteriaceae bacterium]